MRKERGLPVLVELLQSETDKVVRAVAIALRNLSLDRRNKDLIGERGHGGLGPGSPNPAGVASPTLARCPPPAGSYAMAELVRNVRSAQAPTRPGARLEEDTVVAVLNTIHEIVSDSLDNARSLLQARGVPALVALGASRWVQARPPEGRSRVCWGGAWVGGAGWGPRVDGRGLAWAGLGAPRWVGGACGAEPMAAK